MFKDVFVYPCVMFDTENIQIIIFYSNKVSAQSSVKAVSLSGKNQDIFTRNYLTWHKLILFKVLLVKACCR